MGKARHSKDVRRLVRAVEALAGEVRFTTKGHLKVLGPAGIAHVQSDLSAPNGMRGAVAEIVRHAGLDIRASVLGHRQ